MLAALKGKSSATALGVPASSLYYWRLGQRRMTVKRAQDLLAKLRVSWSGFLRSTKPKTAKGASADQNDSLVVTAAALAQLVSRNVSDIVVTEFALSAGVASYATLKWLTWEVKLLPVQGQVWAQLARGGIVLMEGAYSEVLWAEFWRVVCAIKTAESSRRRRQPTTLQLQRRLMRLQSPHGQRTG